MLNSPFFTLGFNNFNIAVSLVMIGLTIWFAKINYEKIEDLLKEKLFNSLNRFFDDESRRPLYEVFYGLHHSSIEAWVAWIKSQSIKKQERAFKRLTNYLLEPAKELGYITKEVVKAVIAFRHPESFETLVQLMQNARENWGKYKSLNLFYENCACGIVALDPTQAETIILNELNAAKDLADFDTLKTSLVTALSQLPDADRVIEAFKKIILDSSHSFKVRLLALNLVEKNSVQAYSELLTTCLKQLIAQSNIKDHELFDTCFNRLLDGINDEDQSTWELLILASKAPGLGLHAVDLVNERIQSSKFQASGNNIFKLLQAVSGKARDNLSLALEKRFDLSNDEKSILSAADELNIISAKSQTSTDSISIEPPKNNLTIPDFMKDNHQKISELVNKKFPGPGIRLITGDADIEKRYLLRAIAAESKKTIIFINVNTIILSPDKIDELESVISEHKPCILYLDEIKPLLLAFNDPANKRALRFFSILQKYFNDSRVCIIGALAKDSISMQDEEPELYKHIKSVPNENFTLKLNLDNLSAKQKQRIFNHYELKLKDDREVALEGIDSLLDATDGFSNITYLNYLLQYMKTSLLSYGKLIPINTYTELLNPATKSLVEH